MADIINLRQVRKDRDRQKKKAGADQNAARFGRAKSERRKQEVEAARDAKALDGHKMEDKE